VTSNGVDDPGGRVVAISNRLRAVQADFADADAPARKEFLLEEIDRALAGLGPAERQGFLKKLADQFPSFDAGDSTPAPAKATGEPAELADWDFLVSRLAQLAPSLSAAQKKSAAERLRGAGLAPAASSGGSGGWSAEHTAALRAKLQLAPDEDLSPNRVAELVDLLHDLTIGLDVLAWNTWKQIAPQSPTRRLSPLQRVLSRFAAGDPEVPKTLAAAEVGRLRRLVAAMISSVGQVGAKFAQDYCGQFAPSQIEDVVKAQGGGGIFGNAKVRFWDQYVQMASTRDPAAVEHEFVSAFAQYAELLMKSAGR
jgi:HAMP domain-containing protein